MVRFLFASGILAGFTLCAQTVDRTKAPTTPPIPTYKLPAVSESKLTNGLSLVMVEDPRFPLTTVRLAFRAGYKYDPKDQPGLAQSVAALLNEGTKTRTFRQLAEELTGIGGSLGGSASADNLTLAGSSLAENADKLLVLLADVAMNANFPADEVQLHKQNRKQSLMAQRSQAEFLAREKTMQVVFGDHPYNHVGPTMASIDKLDQKALSDFRDAYLVPNNAYLVIVGKLPARATLTRQIQELFGGWQRKTIPAYSPTKPPAGKRELVLVDRPGSVQADVEVAKLAPTYGSPEFFPIQVGNTILGGGFSTRLFNDIREKRGYAYDAHSEVDMRKEVGVVSAVTQVRNEVVEPAVQAVLDDMAEMGKAPVTTQELSDAKNFIAGLYLLRLEPQSGLADQLVRIKTMDLPNDYLETYTTRIRSVEPDQIQKAARQYMSPENSAIIVVGDASKIQKSLEKFGTVQVSKPN